MRIRGGARGVSAGDLVGDGGGGGGGGGEGWGGCGGGGGGGVGGGGGGGGGGGVQRKAEVSWERWWVFGEEGWGVEVVLVGKEGVRG